MVALIAAWLTPQSPSVTAPLSGAPRLRRSPALPSLKGKVARERRKGLPRISEGGVRRSEGWLGTRMVAFIAAGLTPQLPFQGRQRVAAQLPSLIASLLRCAKASAAFAASSSLHILPVLPEYVLAAGELQHQPQTIVSRHSGQRYPARAVHIAGLELHAQLLDRALPACYGL